MNYNKPFEFHFFNRSELKKKVIGFLIIFLSCNVSVAQNPFVQDMNAQLRSLFSNLSYPDNEVQFLYQRSVRQTDSVFYDFDCTDTNNFNIFNSIYEELYYAAHDTTSFERIDSVIVDALNYDKDTIPLGIIDYQYYFIKPEAVTTGDYFIFDTVNTLLLDHPAPISSPYEEKNIFLVSVLRDVYQFSSPTFEINPRFFFRDQITETNYYDDDIHFRVDFGDGSGWKYLDPLLENFVTVNYLSSGTKIVRVEMISKDGEVLKSSKSQIVVKKDAKASSPDEILDFPGMEVGVYHGCNVVPGEEKIIIFLEGIDMLDQIKSEDRDLDQIYGSMIEREYINELRNFGYTYYVVNWKQSTIDMRFNALYTLNLIEKLKSQYQNSDHQFVVIGESMGGVIARYVLTFMESEKYQDGNFDEFFVDKDPANLRYLDKNPDLIDLGTLNRQEDLVNLNHKTREFITIDSPHKGANVPLAFQRLYQYYVPDNSLRKTIFQMMHQGLESKASKQLLLFHGAVNNVPSTPVQSFPHPNHLEFYSQLESMGNYPQYCKKVALSSGDLKGTRQENVNEQDQTVNEAYLDISADMYFQLLWGVINLGKTKELHLFPNGNPNGDHVYYFELQTIYKKRIVLKKWKISLVPMPINQISIIYSSKNMTTLDVEAGGYYFFNIDDVNEFIGLGNFAHYLINVDFNIDKVFFNFIPVQSALGWDQFMINAPLNLDITSMNTSDIVSHTPFDVIFGYGKDEGNKYHLTYKDEKIYNVSGLPTSGVDNDGHTMKNTYYTADLNNNTMVIRSLLCLEIGDEELYLENWTLNRDAKFSAQFDVKVNVRNPYYNYPSLEGAFWADLTHGGVYSKENSFYIAEWNNSYAIFEHNDGQEIGNGLTYISPQSNLYWGEQIGDGEACFIDYAEGKSFFITEDTLNEEKCLVYPNPTSLGWFYVELNSQDLSSGFEIDLVDMSGRVIKKKRIQPTDEISSITTFHLPQNLTAGSYIVRVRNTVGYVENQLIIIND